MLDEFDYDDDCQTCHFDEGIVRDEFHGTCFDCGFSIYGGIIDAMYDDLSFRAMDGPEVVPFI